MLLAAAAADIRPRDDNGERPPHHVIIQQIYRSHKDVDRYRPPEQLIWGHLIYIADERESTVNERSHKMYTTLDRYKVSKKHPALPTKHTIETRVTSATLP